MEFTNNDYYSALEDCKNELKHCLKLGINTMTLLFDSPIYPNNEELYNNFVDEYGFAFEEFICFLVKQIDYEISYDEKIIPCND